MPAPLVDTRAALPRADEIEREVVIDRLSRTPPLSDSAIAATTGLSRYRVAQIRQSLGIPARGVPGRPPKIERGSAASIILREALELVDSAPDPEARARSVVLLESAVRLAVGSLG